MNVTWRFPFCPAQSSDDPTWDLILKFLSKILIKLTTKHKHVRVTSMIKIRPEGKLRNEGGNVENVGREKESAKEKICLYTDDDEAVRS